MQSQIEQVIGDFFAQQTTANWSLSLDGKVLRGTIPAGETQGVHLLAVASVEQGVVLMPVQVEAEGNAITAAPGRLDPLDVQ